MHPCSIHEEAVGVTKMTSLAVMRRGSGVGMWPSLCSKSPKPQTLKP